MTNTTLQNFPNEYGAATLLKIAKDLSCMEVYFRSDASRSGYLGEGRENIAIPSVYGLTVKGQDSIEKLLSELLNNHGIDGDCASKIYEYFMRPEERLRDATLADGLLKASRG